MKRKRILWKSWIAFVIITTLPGCWDIDYLKDARVVLGIAMDLTEDGRIEAAVAVREIAGGGEQVKPFNEIYTAVGDTPRQLRDKFDRLMSGEFRAFKNLIVTLGEDLAKQDIYPILDVLYRDPKAALNARIAIVEGRAVELKKIKKVGPDLVSQYLNELIKNEEDETHVPKENLLSIWSTLFDPGQDLVLPYLRRKEDKVEAAGVALFHKEKFSGVTLNPEEATLLLLLRDEKGRIARFSKMINEEAETNVEKFINFDVQKMKHKMEVEVDPLGKVKVKIQAHLTVSVEEYPRDQLEDPKTMEKLNQKLSKQLTMDAKRVIKKLQEANCDALGIGRYLIAFHNEVWKQKNWEEDYAKVKFEPKIEVEIHQHGTID